MEALRLDRGHPEAERIHRVRIGFLLRHSPKLVQFWSRDEPVGAVDLSPDGRRVVIASGTRAELLDAAMGQRVGRPMKDPGTKSVIAALFSQTGDRLLTATEDGTAHVWNARTGEPVGPA